MVLTSYQKELIELISEGKINDFYSFIETITEISVDRYSGPARGSEFENRFENRLQTLHFSSGDKIYCYDANNFDKIKSKLLEFIFLCDFLEMQFLIRSIKLSEGANRKCIMIVQNTHKQDLIHTYVNTILNQLAFERYRYVFEASPAIIEFIKRGYLSDNDYKFKISNKWTKIVAGIAFLGIIATTIVQVIFSGKERDVIINNKNAFQDTAKVLIINPQNTNIDTSKGNSK